jgi:hypothetical protein
VVVLDEGVVTVAEVDAAPVAVVAKTKRKNGR